MEQRGRAPHEVDPARAATAASESIHELMEPVDGDGATHAGRVAQSSAAYAPTGEGTSALHTRAERLRFEANAVW